MDKINLERYAILYVDDEEKSLKIFRRVFKDQFKIYTAANAEEGYQLFKDHKNEIGLLITDQRMPGEKGVRLLEKVRRTQPRVIRILVTAYTDLDAAIDAVNSGAIYKYINKPWNLSELKLTLKQGLELFALQKERDRLMQEKLSILHNMVITDRVINLGMLAAGLGHYVRNSFVAVRTFLDLVPVRLKEEKVDLNELSNPKFWKDFYTHVQNQICRVLKLLDDLGIVSELGSPSNQESLHFNDVIDATLENLYGDLRKKKINVTKKIPENLAPLAVDKAKFHRLFDLLIKDEIIYLSEGSEISISASNIRTGNEDGDKVEIEICDNGPGLPEDELSSLFDPFYLRSDDLEEFGINLMTCYFIVYHHGGKIEVESKEDRGTKFTLTFETQGKTEDTQKDEREFLSEVLMNEKMWEKMLAQY